MSSREHVPDERRAVRLGRMIGDRRRVKGWSQDYLGYRVGISGKHVGGIEQGKRWPSGPVMVRLVVLLKLDLYALADDGER